MNSSAQFSQCLYKRLATGLPSLFPVYSQLLTTDRLLQSCVCCLFTMFFNSVLTAEISCMFLYQDIHIILRIHNDIMGKAYWPVCLQQISW